MTIFPHIIIEMTNFLCPLCRSQEMKGVFVKDGYPIVQCVTCGLQSVHPMPTSEEIVTHYQRAAYFHGEKEQGYREYTAMRKALLPLFQRRMAQIDERFPQRGRLLDFGCAAGYFLEVAQAHGWEVAGVELSAEMAERARAQTHAPVARELDELEGGFDVITLWEVVEHLPRPVETLAALRRRLRPGGLLMLSTPNTGHWQALREPAAWEGYRPPSHLVFFTAETLSRALEQAGFQEVTVQRYAPLPPLPGWLGRTTRPLQQALADGSARPWKAALLAWRAVRLYGWAWQRLWRPQDDIYATLEAMGKRDA